MERYKEIFIKGVATVTGKEREDILIHDGVIAAIGPEDSFGPAPEGSKVIDARGLTAFPGFADIHVHFREPGYTEKETISTGAAAAAHGGYTLVCPMPNTNPVPDSPENLQIEIDAIKKDSTIAILPYCSITKGRLGKELTDFGALKNKCAAFSDDGSGVQNEAMMFEAMKLAAKENVIIAAHCEDNTLLHGGYIHDGEYCKAHGHKGICSESEWGQIKRDIELCRQTGCRYHVCHISTKESVELIRKAKADGVRVTCETAPHYLVLCDSDLQEDGRFKMNPPLRSAEDRKALIEGLKDGTIDAIATDHAPHTAEQKSRGLAGSAMGITGLETAFPVLYTKLVMPGIISLEKLSKLLSESPRRIFSLPEASLKLGCKADLALVELGNEFTINPSEFLSKGKSTPFEGWKVYGKVRATLYGDKIL